ncbi:hypothetical protein CSA80_02085 [Candidatus Saccharibacteria bacterium]|nr:MAG: hypothetical protein CR973_02495 [Candidatus Saccharibacteria bacterium]PID99527.1 MAG: hypothetical protein CSA80_02085 [Candidatus Saccharibacteria bacterium]
MGKAVVQLNGTAYDAGTGQRIADISPARGAQRTAPAQKPKRTAAAKTASAASATRQRKPAAHTKHRATQSSKTLMRHAVKKPASSTKKQLHVQHELTHTTQHAPVVKQTAAHVDAARLHRAQQVEKDHQVRRFHSPAPIPVTFTDLAVQTSPNDPTEPADPAPDIPPPAPIPDEKQKQQPHDMFEQAIANATHYVDIAAHKAHFRKKARRHVAAMSAGIVSLLLIGGFLAYANIPSVQVRVAGVVAGVSTRLPDFRAAGFTYDSVSGENERIVYNFHSELAPYQLIEQQTNWNGKQMIHHVSSVAANGRPNYTQLTAGNIMVYKFSDTHATWVKDGIWYQAHGDQPLSDDQIRALVENS